jgi:hypothetical protein
LSRLLRALFIMPSTMLIQSHSLAREHDMAMTSNQSPEPTAVDAAVAIPATSRRWLSFLR